MSNRQRKENKTLTTTSSETILTSPKMGRNTSETEEKGVPMSVPVKCSRCKHTAGQNVFLDVIQRTLPFMQPHIATMVEVQYLTGLQSKELCRMTVGSIKRHASGLWRCDLGARKDGDYIKKTYISLSQSAHALLVPYLKGKKPEAVVFSPRMAREQGDFHNCGDTYNSKSYREAIGRAIEQANGVLPSDQRIPYWTPCLIEMIASRCWGEVSGVKENLAQWDFKFDDTATHNSEIVLPPVATRFEQYAERQQSIFDAVYGQE